MPTLARDLPMNAALTAPANDATCPKVCEACSARAFSICSVLPHPELRRLADCSAVRAFEPRAELVREGDAAEHVFNITEGMVMLYRLLADGRRQVLGFLLKGDFLGLTAGAAYDIGVSALTPVRVCRFPRPAFRRLLLETPQLEEELLSRASDELLAARAHLTLLGRKTAIERVTSFLLHLADRQVRLGGSPDLIELPMTRTDIADYLGLTPETVSRSLSMLKRLKAIQTIGTDAVRLLKRSMLEDLAEAI
jgi:CRP/FNR family transcriptional regulator